MVLWHRLAPPQAGGDHGEEARRLLAFVLEMMGKIGIEGDAVALVQLVAGAVDDQHQVPARTTAVSRLPGSCIGGSSRPPVVAPGLERVQRDVGALSRQRRGQLLEAMAAPLQ